MLKINGKTFMNLQEAVQWLLDNNALPFQCSANYIANTEIGMGTIVNPSPAKVRIGSLIFFADSKVSTVTGLTENGFIVSDQYNDLVDDVVYVSNVELDANNHLQITLSNGTVIDAGQINAVTSFTINASQHLIVSYIDGTSQDLGSLGDYSNVDFIAKTFEQTQANWSASFTFVPFSAMTSAGLVVTQIYNRFEVIGNMLYLVANVKIENPTAVTYVGQCQMDSYVEIPFKYADKIYDFLGKKASQVADNSYVVITGHCASSFGGTSYTDAEDSDYNLFLCNRDTINVVSAFIIKSTNLTLEAGKSKYISARIPLTLL